MHHVGALACVADGPAIRGSAADTLKPLRRYSAGAFFLIVRYSTNALDDPQTVSTRVRAAVVGASAHAARSG